jgi:hypothetical protein
MPRDVLRYPKSYFRNACIASVICVLVFNGIGSAVWFAPAQECPQDTPGETEAASKFAASVLGATVGLGFAALLLIHGREVRWSEIEISPAHILFSRNGMKHFVGATDVKKARWRCHPVGGALLITTFGARFVIRFDPIPRDERVAAIGALRTLVRDSESGWPEFCRSVALPLTTIRDVDPDTPLSEDEWLYTRRRSDVFCGIATALSLGVAAVVAWLVSFPKLLILPLVVLLLCFPLRFAVPRSGLRIRRKATGPGEDKILMALAAVIVGGTIAWAALEFGFALMDVHFEESFVSIAMIAVALLAFSLPGAIAFAYRNPRRAWHENERRNAVEAWDALEDL